MPPGHGSGQANLERGRSVSPARQPGSRPMNIDIITLQPFIALVAGILILVIPRILNFVVALYLILIGISGLWPHLVR
jgi:hypothetical protein